MEDTPVKEKDKNKSGKIALLIVGILALGLGVWRISYGIKAPFIRTGTEGLAIETEDQKNEKLKQIDTDTDGLNDYEELNIYETSPYLKDSDSDGIDDKTEIDKGTDPNCPEGKTCNALENLTPEGATTTLLAVPSASGELVVPGPVDGTTLTPAEIREVLRQAGASDDALSKISDEELIRIYTESLKQVSAEQGTAGTP